MYIKNTQTTLFKLTNQTDPKSPLVFHGLFLEKKKVHKDIRKYVIFNQSNLKT